MPDDSATVAFLYCLAAANKPSYAAVLALSCGAGQSGAFMRSTSATSALCHVILTSDLVQITVGASSAPHAALNAVVLVPALDVGLGGAGSPRAAPRPSRHIAAASENDAADDDNEPGLGFVSRRGRCAVVRDEELGASERVEYTEAGIPSRACCRAWPFAKKKIKLRPA